MALITKLVSQMPKCNISSYGVLMQHGNIWNICRAFVTSTRPCEKQVIDKETCEKVKEAAEAVTQGVKEVRQTGQFVKETVSNNAGTVITEMAKKAIEKAAEVSEDAKNDKGAWQKLKEAVNGKDKEK